MGSQYYIGLQHRPWITNQMGVYESSDWGRVYVHILWNNRTPNQSLCSEHSLKRTIPLQHLQFHHCCCEGTQKNIFISTHLGDWFLGRRATSRFRRRNTQTTNLTQWDNRVLYQPTLPHRSKSSRDEHVDTLPGQISTSYINICRSTKIQSHTVSSS